MRILTAGKKQILIIYYLVLIVVSFFLMKPNTLIPSSERIVMLFLIFIPTVFNVRLFPFVFLVFSGISRSSFSPILPTNSFYVSLIVIAVFLFYKRKSFKVLGYFLVFFYFFFICAIHLDISQNFLIWIPLAIMVTDMIQSKEDLKYLSYAFLIISLFLSILFLFHREDYLVQYGRMSEGLERSGWINANEFGAVIAAGGVLSAASLVRLIDLKIPVFVNFAILIISFYVLVLNASRGAFFSFVGASAFLLILSKTKIYLKVLIILVSGVIIFYMLDNNVFDLLSYRMQDDTFETGGDRFRIWRIKLGAFFSEDSILQMLLGISRDACNNLVEDISTHNDFVTAIIGYGIIGFLIFIYAIVIYPIRIALKHNLTFVILFLLFLILECFVAEPFFRGNIVIVMFYFYILKFLFINSGYQLT